MHPTRGIGRAIRSTSVSLALVLAVSAGACPSCARAEAVDGAATANGFAAAGGLLLAGPFVLAGIFGLLLGRTLASAGDPSAAKEPI
jgi:hypothetical protein